MKRFLFNFKVRIIKNCFAALLFYNIYGYILRKVIFVSAVGDDDDDDDWLFGDFPTSPTLNSMLCLIYMSVCVQYIYIQCVLLSL